MSEVSGKSKLMKDKKEWSLSHQNTNESLITKVDLPSPALGDSIGASSSVEYFSYNPSTDPKPVFKIFKYGNTSAGSVPKPTSKIFFPSCYKTDQNLPYRRNNDHLTQSTSNILKANSSAGNGRLPNLQQLSLGDDNDSHNQYTRQESVVSMDGPQSATPTPSPSSSVPFSSSVSMSTSSSSKSANSPDSSSSQSSFSDMQDFVILHTESDLDSVQSFKDNLIDDAADEMITVDLFSEIDVGTTEMRSIATLHDRYRYILIYVTDNLVDDRSCRFLHEILITLGLSDGGSKADRVVPVFTKSGNCKILELSIIGGLNYHRRSGGTSAFHAQYLRTVKNLVQCARQKFPL